MSLCKGEGPSYPILKTFRDFLVKKIDFLLIVFSFPTPQVPSPPTKVSQNLIYFSGDPTSLFYDFVVHEWFSAKINR